MNIISLKNLIEKKNIKLQLAQVLTAFNFKGVTL